jgi:hypothetical protein
MANKDEKNNSLLNPADELKASNTPVRLYKKHCHPNRDVFSPKMEMRYDGIKNEEANSRIDGIKIAFELFIR